MKKQSDINKPMNDALIADLSYQKVVLRKRMIRVTAVINCIALAISIVLMIVFAADVRSLPFIAGAFVAVTCSVMLLMLLLAYKFIVRCEKKVFFPPERTDVINGMK